MSFSLPSLSTREAVVGLDIGDGFVAAVQVEPSSNGTLRVLHAGWTAFERGLPDRELAGRIRALWREFAIPTFTVCSCLRSQSLTLKPFRYAKLSRGEVDSALRLDAEEALQMPQGELVVDSHVNRMVKAEGGRTDECGIEGIMVAVPRGVVNHHTALLRNAGLYPVVLDVAAMANGNLFLRMKGNWVKGAVCLVSLSEHTADIAVLFDGACIYPRTIVSRSSGWDEALDYLMTNIKDSLKYFEYKLRRAPVENLVFTGDIARPADFLDRVRGELPLPVELWNPMNDVEMRPSRKDRLLEAYHNVGPLMTTSLGLALRGGGGATR